MSISRHNAKSYSLKILPISPYNSRILVSSWPQLHCFHRPGGRGVPAIGFGRRSEVGTQLQVSDGWGTYSLRQRLETSVGAQLDKVRVLADADQVAHMQLLSLLQPGQSAFL